MKLSKFHIYSADLNPGIGTEPGKTRPVVIVQTNLLNNHHPSTVICPLTTKTIDGSSIMRIRLNKKINHLNKESDILVDQIRAIDNRRFKKEIGTLSKTQRKKLEESLKTILFE